MFVGSELIFVFLLNFHLTQSKNTIYLFQLPLFFLFFSSFTLIYVWRLLLLLILFQLAVFAYTAWMYICLERLFFFVSSSIFCAMQNNNKRKMSVASLPTHWIHGTITKEPLFVHKYIRTIVHTMRIPRQKANKIDDSLTKYFVFDCQK